MATRRPPRLPPPGDTPSTPDTISPHPASSVSSTSSSMSSTSSTVSVSSTSPVSASPGSARSAAGVLPAQAHLTDRDRRIADWLDRHGVLTTAQITAVFFRSPITAAHRLAKLRTVGLVDRFHRPIASGGFGPWHWVIGPLGAEITAASRDEAPPTAAALRRRHARLADSSHLAHRLGTNQFFIDLHTHARHSAGTAALRLWWSERDTAKRFRRPIRAAACSSNTTPPARRTSPAWSTSCAATTNWPVTVDRPTRCCSGSTPPTGKPTFTRCSPTEARARCQWPPASTLPAPTRPARYGGLPATHDPDGAAWPSSPAATASPTASTTPTTTASGSPSSHRESRDATRASQVSPLTATHTQSHELTATHNPRSGPRWVQRRGLGCDSRPGYGEGSHHSP